MALPSRYVPVGAVVVCLDDEVYLINGIADPARSITWRQIGNWDTARLGNDIAVNAYLAKLRFAQEMKRPSPFN